jgi:transposase-like protein
MTQAAGSCREDVEQLRRRFSEFRSTHAVRSRLPEELWAAAAKLARRDGIEATAQVLDVDRPSLQKWMNRFEPRAEAKPRKPPRQRQPGRREHTTPAFVELLAGTTGAAASCLVEVESPRGAKLRLELKSIPTSDLAELIRAFAAS